MRKKIYIMAFIILIFDQISKLILIKNLSSNEVLNIIPNFFYITLVKNTGGAWSILNNNTWFLIVVSIVMLVVVNFYLKKEDNFNRIFILSYTLLIGGILGNLVDRIMNGYVIDFLGFNIFGYGFPVFNIADTSIVCGVLLMIWEILKGENNSEYNSKR